MITAFLWACLALHVVCAALRVWWGPSVTEWRKRRARSRALPRAVVFQVDPDLDYDRSRPRPKPDSETLRQR